MISKAVEGEGDGIGDYTSLLQQHLCRAGTTTDVFAKRGVAWHSRVAGTTRFAVSDPIDMSYDAVLIHYNAFMYGRWGFAPWLPALLWSLRRQRRHPLITLMLHEPYVPIVGPKSLVMGSWQRAQLWAVAAACDRTGASIEAWRDLLSNLWPRRPAAHLPVSSNLPDMSAHREEARAELGLTEGQILVVTFGTDHPSHKQDLVSAAMEEIIRAADAEVAILELGRRTKYALVNLPRKAVHRPGPLPASSAGRLLAAGDVFLAPFVDGVSTRRGTFMAAIQHGLSVVATDGPLTDECLRKARDALVLVPVGSASEFAAAAVRTANDRATQRARSQAARTLYRERFDWPAATERILTLIGVGD
jgi:glycosyltransferase involved in cell wall biosynthesis